MNRVRELLETGKAKGTLTYKEIMDQLVEVELEPEQFEKILETLETLGVDVVNEIQLVEAEPANEAANDDLDLSVPEGISIDDPVRMYLKEIGKVPLLSADVFRFSFGSRILRRRFFFLVMTIPQNLSMDFCAPEDR
jgi:RNA polymerase primary sigma factor